MLLQKETMFRKVQWLLPSPYRLTIPGCPFIDTHIYFTLCWHQTSQKCPQASIHLSFIVRQSVHQLAALLATFFHKHLSSEKFQHNKSIQVVGKSNIATVYQKQAANIICQKCQFDAFGEKFKCLNILLISK